jgi:hypothetical protein
MGSGGGGGGGGGDAENLKLGHHEAKRARMREVDDGECTRFWDVDCGDVGGDAAGAIG